MYPIGIYAEDDNENLANSLLREMDEVTIYELNEIKE
jgi:hypothetical protein